MGAQKHGSKGGGGGGYVGGFLHLFDWNAKSRKKLFSSKSESPEQPKQTKRTDGNMPVTRFNTMEEDEMRIGGLNYKESSDYSCATSITDDDNYGTKAPGVVARLMGLDSLPNFNFSDTYSNPSFDSQSFKDSSTPYITKDPKFESIDHQMEAVKSTPQKRAFEKFQTEALPPKSAKSIPITRHKLLSPIKNSKYVSSSNPKSIMEAATKIPLVGSSSSFSSPSPSSSVPFRVKVAKEKMENLSRKPKVPEGSRRPLESNISKNVKVGTQSLEPKKSISLALQAKANVQKREGLNHRSQSVKTQSNTERNPQNVLKQNNQKQNSLVDRGKSTPQTRKQISSQKNSSKVSENTKTSHKKEPYSTTRRKRSIEDNNNNNNHGEKNVVRDKSYRSNRNDVVSFTFTSPIARNVNTTNHASNSSSLNHNVIGGDALSTLLEQKLRELTCLSQDSSMEGDIRDDSSHGFSSYDPLHFTRKNQEQDMINRDDSSYGFSSYDPLHLMNKHTDQDMITRDDFSSYDPLQLMKKHSGQDRIKDDLTYGFSSNNNPQELMKHNKLDQFIEPISECSTNDYEYRKYLRARQPSPNSVLEQSFITESCNSSDTAESCKPNSTSVKAQELITNTFSRNSTPMDVDTELLDSASSTSQLTKWEPNYVTQVLSDIETMFKDFTIGKTRKIVNPRVFDRLEFGQPNEEVVRLRRELVFNCVSECMETRCRVWGKGLGVVSRPDRLAQDVYKEIVGWEDMKDSMVDELVDKDMSGEGYKRWLDFDVEAFEYGVEIESWLIDSLIDEVVDDMLVL